MVVRGEARKDGSYCEAIDRLVPLRDIFIIIIIFDNISRAKNLKSLYLSMSPCDMIGEMIM